ncbi:MAG: hypothetical protein ACM3OF_02100 [Gemmatimonas sp.]
MKSRIGWVALMVLLTGTAALAQSGGGSGGGGSGSSAGQGLGAGIPQAPIGHRQPRASDVPTEKNLNNPNNPTNKEDAILDKKIKSICRGC